MNNHVSDGIDLKRAAGKAAKGESPTSLATAIRTAPMYAIKNKKHISSLTMCGCFSCLEYFGSCEITEWTDNSQTALCPKCGADCVIPASFLGTKDYYPVGNEPHPVLKAIQQYWIPQIPLCLTQNTTGPAPAVVVNSGPADKVSELLVLSGLDEPEVTGDPPCKPDAVSIAGV